MSPSADDLRQRLRSAGLGRVAEELTSAVQSALRLTVQPAEEMLLPLGRSRIGGHPDVPQDFEWPEWKGVPLSFLGQIDLAEASRFPCCDVLPETGRLLFFYDAAQDTWGFDPDDRGSFTVVHSPAPTETVVRHDWPAALPAEARYWPCEVGFSEVLTLPDPWSIPVDGLGLTDEESERYAELLEEMEPEEGDGMLHQLLGHPSPIQGEMQLECQLAANGIFVGTPAATRIPDGLSSNPEHPRGASCFNWIQRKRRD